MDKQSLCIDVLVNGYCQAYVDFFYLTHRPEPTGPEEKSEDAGIPPEKLPFVKSHLADAEAARRQGEAVRRRRRHLQKHPCIAKTRQPTR